VSTSPEQTIVALLTGATGVQAATARSTVKNGMAIMAGTKRRIDR